MSEYYTEKSLNSLPQESWQGESHDDVPSPVRQKIMLAVLGVVGAGKTSFIDTVNKKGRVRESTLEPSKPEIGTTYVPLDDDREIIFVDVPGFDNPMKPDILILRDFLTYVHNKAIENIKLSGILYLHRITDVRMGGSAIKNMKLLQGICGEPFLPRLTLVTTMWDIIQKTDGDRREEDLKQNFWSDLLHHDAGYERYDGTMDDARKVIKRYLRDPLSHTAMASIQQQAGWPLGQTDVGRLELESIQQAKHQHMLRYKVLERQQTEPPRPEIYLGDLKEEQDSLEEELKEEQRKIAELNALLPIARYSARDAKFDLESRYKRSDEMADPVQLTLHNHPDRLGRLDNPGNNLESQYEQTGNIVNLEEVIELARQPVGSTLHDYPDRTAHPNSLGNKLENQYERTGDVANSEEAIKLARQTVGLTLHSHPDWLGRIDYLGNNPESRYERTNKVADPEEDIGVARQAVGPTPHDHPDHTAYPNSLGNKLESQCERTGDVANSEEAIEFARQPVGLTLHSHPDWLGRMDYLGNNPESRYGRTSKVADPEEGIGVARQAVVPTPHDHPDHTAYPNRILEQPRKQPWEQF